MHLKLGEFNEPFIYLSEQFRLDKNVTFFYFWFTFTYF